jgi:PAS domain S-box-containing protein
MKQRMTLESKPANAQSENFPVGPVALVIGAIVTITLATIYFDYLEINQREGARVEALAESRANQVEAWLAHCMSEAEFVRSSVTMADDYLQWRDRGNRASLGRLIERAGDYRKANEYESALVANERGEMVARDVDIVRRGASPELKAAVLRALASGKTQRTEIYHREGSKLASRMDFAIPLVRTGQPARGAIALRIDPGKFLFPLLQTWPVDTYSGEALLVRRDGDQITFLSPLRHQPDLPATLTLSDNNLLAMRTTTVGAPPGRALRGVDYRGVAVFGAAHPVAGSDWLVVAKIDHAELVDATLADALWIALIGLLTIVATVVLGAYYRTQNALRNAIALHQEQSERLRALQLLDAIADSSSDAIFANDRDGRYLMFNRGASRLTGKLHEAVIGNDDYAVFPPEQAEMVRRGNVQVIAEGKPITFEESLTTAAGERVFLTTKGPLRDGGGNITGTYGISRDITDMKQAETALRQSEARYRSMIHALSEGIVLFDTEGSVLAANPAAERFFGFPEAEIIERWREPRKSPPPLDENGVPVRYEDRAVVKAIATGQPQRNVIHGRAMPDGSIRWNSINAEPVRETANGPVNAAIVSFTDITPRRAAEQQLRKLSLAVEQSFSSIVITDTAGRIEYVNAAFSRATGYDNHELIGKNPSMLQSGKTSRVTFELMWAVLARGEPWTGEFINRRKNGEEYIENIEISPIRQGGGQITHFVGIWEDITERKRIAEELDHHRHHLEELVAERTRALEQSNTALRASENFITTIADNVPGAISYWDLDMRCLFANKTYQRWWGKTPAEMMGRRLQDILDPERLTIYEAQFAAALRGEPQQMERTHVQPDGETSYAWSNYIPEFRDGRVAGFYVLATDITALKQVEIRLHALNDELSQAHDALQRQNSALAIEIEQRRRAETETRRLNEILGARKQALERSMKNLEAFSYSVSHDLRAPLRAISGYAKMLVETESDRLSDDGRRMLDRIIAGAHKQDSLIRDILDYSRTERLQRRNTRVDTATLAALVAQDLMVSHPHATFEASGLPVVTADAVMVQQIFANLIGNAFKFSSRRSDARIEVGATTVNGVPEFFVRDNGAGFNQKYAGKLFNLFQRMHGEQEFPGTGVGLATVKRLIEIHGGRISAESEPDEQTTFRFTLAPEAGAAPRA